MSGVEENFLKAIGKLGKKKPALVTIGIATEINLDKYTCTVKREDRADLQDVRLNSCEFNGTSRFTVVPDDESEVLVCLIDDNPAEAFIVACSLIANVIIKVGDSSLEVNGEGHQIIRGDENLKTIMTDLVDLVIQIGAYKDVPGLLAIKQRLNNIFQ